MTNMESTIPTPKERRIFFLVIPTLSKLCFLSLRMMKTGMKDIAAYTPHCDKALLKSNCPGVPNGPPALRAKNEKTTAMVRNRPTTYPTAKTASFRAAVNLISRFLGLWNLVTSHINRKKAAVKTICIKNCNIS